MTEYEAKLILAKQRHAQRLIAHSRKGQALTEAQPAEHLFTFPDQPLWVALQTHTHTHRNTNTHTHPN